MGSDGQSESQFAARGVDEIRAWLTQRLSEELGISPGDIAPGEPFESFGLASRDAVTLSGDLEDWLQRKLSPTLLWEYPTIKALADYLGKASAQPESDCAPSREAREGERVAIIGIGCRFPGASSPEALWRLLHDGVDAITEVPAERWDARQYYDPSPGTPGKMCTKWGGFLENIDQFDPQFFNISPREAARMDPQQRLLLETSWEALERAGVAPDGLAGSATGVFVGISAADYAQLQFGEPQRIDAYAGSGNALSIAANRISYALDLRGPSVALDTACSSSLVAVHWACRSLLSGECALALAGGVNLTLAPETTITFSQARMMALDGRCKTFDAAADGYVRGEGCGIVVLKRLSEAVRDGDPIIAVIRGTAINHDGRSNGLTAPNGLAQQAVVRAALTDAGVTPSEIDYVEAHGTGTSLGDPIEVDSLKAALLEGRSGNERCALGSIKTNIGHLEAAAGIAGLIKAALSLFHEEIPPHLHLKTLNPLVEIESTPFWIPVDPVPWRRGTRARLAGVSAFGFGGTNAHAILEEAPALDGAQHGTLSPPPVLCLSAHTEDALRALARDYSVFLRDRPNADLGALCFTASLGRIHFARRLGVVASSREAALEQLERIGRGESSTETAAGEAARGVKPKIAFLFTGQGAQYPGMGRHLYETEPVFRGALDRCAEILRPHMTGSLLDTMYASTADDTAIHMTANSQPALFALEYALAELWRSWGIVPEAVLGHSLGEYVAACVAGAFTLEEGLALVARRAQLMQALPPDGTMVAVLASSDKVLAALEGFGDRVSVAAINGSEHTVLSGGKTDLASLTERLEGEGVSIRPMSVSHAFHSRLIEPMLDDLDEASGKVAYRPLQIPLVSNRTGAILEPGYVLDASYWRGHARETVQFQSCMLALIGQRFDTFVEIGPHPVLAGMGRRCAPENLGAWLPSLRKDREDGETLAHSVAQLYVRGAAIDWRAYYHGYAPRRVAAPTYPFQRRRYWFDVSVARHGSGIPALESAPPFEAERESVAACRYGLEWRRRDRIHRETKGAGKREHGTWLVFSDTTGVGDAVAAALRERGGTCVLVTHSGKVTAQEPFRRFLDPVQNDGYRALIDDVLSAVELPLCGVIHLWSLDAPEPQCGVVDSLARAHALSCESVLHILHALEPRSHAIAPHPRLWVVTRDVQPAGPSRTPLSLAQSPVWGLGRSAALEFPQIWGGLIDVDATGAANAAAICAEALEPDGEEQAAFRDGLRYVARVTPRDRSSAASAVFRADGTYLITGGFGDLGLLCAQWMAERGARRIVLTGRTALPARTHWDSVTDVVARHAITAVQGLEACGVSVIIAQADAADRGRMAEVFDDLARTMPPLRGIIHAAGTVQPLLLHDVDTAALSAAMRPKVEGAWVLHELSRSAPLDFFVLYSSISSVWGSKGLAHYAAANHFLDTLAHHRRALGLVATSVNWGPWAGSRGEAEHHSLLTRMGLTPLTNGRGLTLLDEIAGSDAAQEIAAAVDWPAFKRVYEIAAPRPLISELGLASEDEPASNGSVSEILSALQAAPHPQRAGLLASYLRTQVGQVLYLSADAVPMAQDLMTLGLDSLMIMEVIAGVSKDLNIKLYPREVFERPTIEALSEYIALEFDRDASAAGDASTSGELSQPGGLRAHPNTWRKPARRIPGIVFLLSSPRSGSTLLRVMMAGHPDLFCPPELHLLPFSTMSEREETLGATYLDEGLQRALMELSGGDAADTRKMVSGLVERGAPIQEVYALLQERAGSRLLVDKSPTYAIDRENLEHAEELFEGAKYVHLVRHPYAVIESFVRTRMDKMLGLASQNPFFLAERIWTDTNRNTLEFSAAVGPQRSHRILYEDLVKDPRRTATDLCAFLGIPFHEALLRPYEGRRMTEGIHAQSLPIGDPNFHNHVGIDAALGEAWKRVRAPRALSPAAVQLATAFGYELSRENSPSNAPADSFAAIEEGRL